MLESIVTGQIWQVWLFKEIKSVLMIWPNSWSCRSAFEAVWCRFDMLLAAIELNFIATHLLLNFGAEFAKVWVWCLMQTFYCNNPFYSEFGAAGFRIWNGGNQFQYIPASNCDLLV